MTPALAAAVKQPHGPLVKPKIEPGTGAGVAKKPGMPPMMPGMGMPGMPPFGMPPGMMMPGMGMFPPGGRMLFSLLCLSSAFNDTLFSSCSPLLSLYPRSSQPALTLRVLSRRCQEVSQPGRSLLRVEA